MNIILHIGQSKTGTTAIQSFLSINRRILREGRILYPTAQTGNMPIGTDNHNAVADSLLGVLNYPGLSDEAYFDHFFDSAAKLNADTIVLSSEHFFGGQPRRYDVSSSEQYVELYTKKLVRLRELLRGCDVNIILYLRPQVDWLSSGISQTIRIQPLISGRPTIYRDDRQFFDLVKEGLKYSQRLEIWEDIIRPKSFDIIPYIETDLSGGDSVRDFLLRSNLNRLNFPKESKNRRPNESYSREYVELKKKLNRIPHTKIEERVIQRCLSELSKNSRFGRVYNVDESVVRDLEEYVRVDNEIITKKYLKTTNCFIAMAGYKSRERRPITCNDYKMAKVEFRKLYNHPYSIIRHFDMYARSILRRKARPIHTILHYSKKYIENYFYDKK